MDINSQSQDEARRIQILNSFIGDKEKILPKIQEYIKDNKHHYIDVFFGSVKDSQQVV
jgi:hypothetical protein